MKHRILELAAAIPLALFLPAACGGKAGTSAPPAARPAVAAPGQASLASSVWKGTLPAADGPAKAVTLELMADGTARMTTTAGDGPATERKGKWRVESGVLHFDPVEKNGSAGPRVSFGVLGNRLNPAAWPGDDWGPTGPPALEKS